jgi:hypothetical protein
MSDLHSEHITQTKVDTQTKALTLNLNENIYGTIAEIGAGQEIAGWLFKVGGAAGTVAKTMSAYDMTVSDDIYGKTTQYVSEARLNSMLSHEYSLLNQRLASKFGNERSFFVLADTVSARNFKGTNECHGWIGIRYQENPNEEPVDITLHVNLLDNSNFAQQEAMGILGINLIYAAYYLNNDLPTFLKSLIDEVGGNRIEIDQISFKGGKLSNISSKIIALELIYCGLAPAVLISKNGDIVLSSSVFRKKRILIERGSYRVLRDIGNNSIEKAKNLLAKEGSSEFKGEIFINEISIKSIHKNTLIPKQEMELVLNSMISECEQIVMISAFTWYYDISKYLKRYSKEPLAFVMGIITFMKLFIEDFYDESSGSLLEALGKLLAIGAKVYVYPMPHENFEHLKDDNLENWHIPKNDLVDLKDIYPLSHVQHLFKYLTASKYVVSLSLEDQ